MRIRLQSGGIQNRGAIALISRTLTRTCFTGCRNTSVEADLGMAKKELSAPIAVKAYDLSWVRIVGYLF